MGMQVGACRTGGAVIGLLFLTLALSACVSDGVPDKKLPHCGQSGGDLFSSGQTSPALDEGNGRISFTESYFLDAGVGGSFFYLLDCKSGEGVRWSQEGYVESVSKVPQTTAERTGPTMVELIDSLRASGDLQDFKAVMMAGKKARFESRPTKADTSSETSICACKTYYRDTIGPWAKE